MAELSVTLPADLQGYVDAQVAVEGFTDPADFVRDLIRRHRDDTASEIARVRALWDEGIASGMLDDDPRDVIEQIIAEIPARDG